MSVGKIKILSAELDYSVGLTARVNFHLANGWTIVATHFYHGTILFILGFDTQAVSMNVQIGEPTEK